MNQEQIVTIEKRNIIILDVILFLFSIVPFFLTHAQAIGYSAFNYFFLQAILFIMAGSMKLVNRNTFLLSPSFIAVSYINLNFFVGSIVFPLGLIFDLMLTPYRHWHHADLSMAYFNGINFFIINAFFVSKKFKLPKVRPVFDISRARILPLLCIGVLLIFAFSSIDVELEALGGQGSFSIIPKSIGAIIIFLVFFRNFKLRHRIACYVAVIVLFSVASFEDKRDAIFLLLPIILLESTRYPLTIGFKRLALATISILFLSYLILVMSILRGYGSYNAKGFLDATRYVPDYIQSDFFVPAFMNNLEISFTYFHSNNAIEYVLDDPNKLAYGSTILKPFFIPIPRKLYPDKPDSIIELYTSTFSKEMRKRGVSWVISFQSELFWNFHFAGIIAGFFFFLLFNCAYLNILRLIELDKIINYVPLLYLYQQMLVLFRGSGLDQYMIDIIFSFTIFLVIKLAVLILNTRLLPRVARE